MGRTFQVAWQGCVWDVPDDPAGQVGYELMYHTCSEALDDFPLVNRLLRTCGATLRVLPDLVHRRFSWAHTHLNKPPLETY